MSVGRHDTLSRSATAERSTRRGGGGGEEEEEEGEILLTAYNK